MNTEHYFEDIGAWPKSERGVSHVAGAYVIGFVLSLLCTFTSFVLVLHHLLSARALIAVIIILALIQVGIQVRCFLHMGKGVESRARFIMLGLTSVVVFILVAGSLWIMFDLNQRMMPTTAQMMEYMQRQAGI